MDLKHDWNILEGVGHCVAWQVQGHSFLSPVIAKISIQRSGPVWSQRLPEMAKTGLDCLWPIFCSHLQSVTGHDLKKVPTIIQKKELLKLAQKWLRYTQILLSYLVIHVLKITWPIWILLRANIEVYCHRWWLVSNQHQKTCKQIYELISEIKVDRSMV